jgi:putative transposase
MPERLRRLSEVFQRFPIYFVTACTYQRRGVLDQSDIHQSFIGFAQARETRGAWVGAYILMPDHFHACVAIDDRRLTISAWMKSLKNTCSHVFRKAGLASPHWKKGFFDHILRSGESYSEKWKYVRENPVRAGLVRDWNEWPYQGEIFALQFEDDRA